ncbi:MAG TPA: RdgB/HAM1 family non-canonical purine NTP pyrophosphatase [Gammaproteobacteria bacterium]|nr:RdgB/HAM1 family non-canonical purine NTP pyrophosphatase [Gammaproteobacteria bacterium]
MSRPAGGASFILATTNPGKLAEYRELFADAPITFEALDAATAPEETGRSFVENALIKARHASASRGGPTIADDSGLCVAALGGAPGVRSARYAGPDASDRDNLERLLAELAGVEPGRRDAFFHCVIVALSKPEDPAPVIASGRWNGRIAMQPSGAGGFGYDPVFYDPKLGMTAAELSPETKNAVSHRARARVELRRLLGF